MLKPDFAEPFFTLLDNGLVKSSNRVFFLTRRINRTDGLLYGNVGRNGQDEIEWVLDRNGQFFEMTSLGLIPKTLPQKLGLARQKERFRVEPPRAITVGELKLRLAGLKDAYPEVPVAKFTRGRLKRYNDALIVDANIVAHLMGLDEK